MEMTPIVERSAAWAESWWTFLMVLGAATLVGLALRFLVFRRLRQVASRTATRADDVLMDATRGFWLPATILVGALSGLRFAPISPEHAVVAERFGVSVLLLLVTLAASRFVGLRFAASRAAAGDQPAQPSLVQKVVQVAVMIAGALLILDNAGVEITTLLTALGIGSLAVALALQPTLSNLFAGLHLSVSKPIRVGDFVELEDGTQGHVADIGWRVTKLTQPANSVVMVPNARISDMRLVNYSMPSPAQTVSVRFTVAFGSDLSAVESSALEVAREVQREVAEADSGYAPAIVFRAFGTGGIDCEVALRTRSMPERAAVVSAYVRRLDARFRADGIVVPYPQQVVHLSTGSPEPAEPPEPPA